MLSISLASMAAWCLVARSALAQQFPMMMTPYEMFDLSGPCVEALNTTIDCDDKLARHVVWDASSVGILDQDSLGAVCKDTCRQSLVDLRGKISGSCDAKTDTIQYKDMAYPATYIADRYLYFYDVSCYKDKSTGDFCDATVAGWRNETDGSAAHFCHDCWLGPMSVQLSSPIGYNEERAQDFASLTASCSLAGVYAPATPTPYARMKDEADFGLLEVTPTTASSAVVETAPPMLYPLLEVGTADSAKKEKKPETRGQRRRALKNIKKEDDRPAVTSNPHAPRTADDCTEYQDFRPFELLYKNPQGPLELLDDYGINGCRYTAMKHEISLHNLLAWNPSLDEMDERECKLQRGYSYCVKRQVVLATSTA